MDRALTVPRPVKAQDICIQLLECALREKIQLCMFADPWAANESSQLWGKKSLTSSTASASYLEEMTPCSQMIQLGRLRSPLTSTLMFL